jgi:hypothetical protein
MLESYQRLKTPAFAVWNVDETDNAFWKAVKKL